MQCDRWFMRQQAEQVFDTYIAMHTKRTQSMGVAILNGAWCVNRLNCCNIIMICELSNLLPTLLAQGKPLAYVLYRYRYSETVSGQRIKGHDMTYEREKIVTFHERIA